MSFGGSSIPTGPRAGIPSRWIQEQGQRGPGRRPAALDDLGIPRWAERPRNEADRVGLRASASILTKTEGRVAELVASGRSNQEVAAELFASTKPSKPT